MQISPMNLNYKRAGSGEPLVLIHGIGSRWQMWEPVIPLLIPHRDVIAIDLPGFADSPSPPPGTPAGIDSLVRLVAEFFPQLGIERPHVAGNSLGGWIALELAKRDLVRSAAGLSPAGFHTPGEARFERASLWSAVRAARLLEPFAERINASPTARKVAFGQFVEHPERLSPQDAIESSAALAHAPWFDDTLDALVAERFIGAGRPGCKVTVAWGEKDRLLLPRQASRAAAAVPGARMVLLHGCGHVPTYDDPDQVARVLLDASTAL
jgi:pimeloyl-ACP methyl ester carboxylesterase